MRSIPRPDAPVAQRAVAAATLLLLAGLAGGCQSTARDELLRQQSVTISPATADALQRRTAADANTIFLPGSGVRNVATVGSMLGMDPFASQP